MADRTTAVGAETSLADRKRRAGQRLIIGIPGPHVDDDTRALIKELQPAGFCLFQRNVEEPAQVLELNRELASLCDERYPALLTVDQEGGRVQRIRAPGTVWPAMRAVGGAAEQVEAVSRAIAVELRAMGFNLNFAPVADVDSNPDNPVIGDRSFGRDPATVGQLAAAFATAHQDEGVIACAKHFPGHGDTALDSHLALPSVEKSEGELRSCELVPFRRAVQAGVATVMSSHVVFPALDPELPVTLSPIVIPRLLRGELGFDGVIFSDDMEMKAVAGRWSTERQVDLGTRAGIDVFLVCATPTLQLGFFEALVRSQEGDDGHDKAAEASVKRVQALRERFFLDPKPAPRPRGGRQRRLPRPRHPREGPVRAVPGVIALLFGLAPGGGSAQLFRRGAARGPGDVGRLGVARGEVGRTPGAGDGRAHPRSSRPGVASEGGGSVARMLQHLGLRGSAKEPKKRWKVVIFDAEPGDLCRPVAGHDDPRRHRRPGDLLGQGEQARSGAVGVRHHGGSRHRPARPGAAPWPLGRPGAQRVLRPAGGSVHRARAHPLTSGTTAVVICIACHHENPLGSRFCNQCGSKLEDTFELAAEQTEETFLDHSVPDFAIPGSAAGRSLAIQDILYGSATAAEAGLAAVGAIPQPTLRTEFDVPGLGTIVRCFGVMRNNLDTDELTDAGQNLDMLAFDPVDLSRFHQASTAASNRVARMLQRPDNERVVAKLHGGRLKYLPMNRLAARRVELDLAEVGLHLPWSIGGLDVTFGERCRRALQGYGFVCFFGHLGRIEPFNGVPGFRRTREGISVPFGVEGYHTWEAPISDEILDEDVGLLIEADAIA